MAHHSFFITGDLDRGMTTALSYVEKELDLHPQGNPDVIRLSFGLLSVDEARRFTDLAYRMPATGDRKVLIASAHRFFHEAQNALLKIFEEPPEGTTLILVLPSEGVLLPTLRSRLLPLPGNASHTSEDEHAKLFLDASPDARKKQVEKLLDRTKSDNDSEKQAARLEALQLAEGLMRVAYASRSAGNEDPELLAFIEDLNRFIPMLHDRSAPLKQIFEHLLIVAPQKY
jgi:DNA polymerase III delta prime subunit